MVVRAARSVPSQPQSSTASPILTFGIPLRSATTARDWPQVCRLLDHTLASALAQPNVAAIVACHELPDSRFRNDPRVTFLQVDIDRPTTPNEQRLDKRFKKNRVMDEQCRRGGGYLMILDADDLVSNRLAAYVARDDNRRGYLVTQGHVFNARRRHMQHTDRFNRRCGSCGIFYLRPEDIAENWTAELADTPHRLFHEVTANRGRPIDPVAFPASLYVFNHGQNLSMTGPAARRAWVAALIDGAARAVSRVVPGRGGSAALRAEFGLVDKLDA